MGFQGIAGQKNDNQKREERPAVETTGRDGIILPPDPAIPRQVAPQQSLLPFRRTPESATGKPECQTHFKTRQTRLPGRKHLNPSSEGPRQRRSALKTDHFYGKTELHETSIPLLHHSVHLLVLTRPSLAGSNAPPDMIDTNEKENRQITCPFLHFKKIDR